MSFVSAFQKHGMIPAGIDSPENGAANRSGRLIGAIVLVLAVWFAFQPTVGCGFVNYDDDLYILENRNISNGWSGHAVYWALTTFHAANWHPVTWLSHMTDIQLFGLNPAGHHLSSLVLHLGNVLLLFSLLLKMTGELWPSLLTAALFGVHPLHVESVVWISERKDVLSTFGGLASLWCYAGWVTNGGHWRYLLSIAWLAIGLSSKPMLVTWPFVMLLLDYWPLQRVKISGKFRISEIFLIWTSCDQRKLLIEKIPYFVLSALSCIVTVLAQHTGGAIGSMTQFSIGARISNAIVGPVLYLYKTVFPVNLAFFYPHPGQRPLWQVLLALAIVFLGFWVSVKFVRKKPYIAVGWCWYLGTLLPVSGLVQVGAQSVADRYTYIPLIGIFLILAWVLKNAVQKWGHQWTFVTLILSFVLACMSLTRIQVQHWKDSESLLSHAIQAVEGNYIAYHNLGVLYLTNRYADEAIEQIQKALDIKPDYPRAHINIAVALADKGRHTDAIEHLQTAIRMDPDNAAAYHNLGVIFSDLGRREAAIESLYHAARYNPNESSTLVHLGKELMKTGQIDAAIHQLKTAFQLNPSDPVIKSNLSRALKMKEDRVKGKQDKEPEADEF